MSSQDPQPPAHTRSIGGPGFAYVDRALGTMARYDMVGAGDTVVVAVSGGPDSTCLWDILWRAATRLDIQLVLAHVDHGLSPEAEDVSAALAARAAEAGFDVHVARASNLAGPNLQERARIFRYRFFETIAERVGATHVATGHTLDDRVETTLARLIHGAGTSGLAGLPPTDGKRIRPLVDLRRSETRAYCDECDLAYYEDPANDDDRFERVAVRKRLISAMEERWGPGAVRALAKSSERMREDAVALDGLAAAVFSDAAQKEADGFRFDRARLSGLPRALQRRVLELAVGRVRDRSGGIEAALDALGSNDRTGLRFAVASGTEIRIHAREVVVARGKTSNAAAE